MTRRRWLVTMTLVVWLGVAGAVWGGQKEVAGSLGTVGVACALAVIKDMEGHGA
jgi:hypothetical protein